MEFRAKKQAFICLFFCVLGHLYAEMDERTHFSSPIIVEEVPVGVILDMGSKEGNIILSCISMALSDFYHLHSNYSTRVVLHSRDSNGKPLHALSAALNLLDNIKVEAIIGAQTKMEANLLAELGEDADVPVMSLSQPSPSPPLTDRYPFAVGITQDETSQVMGISTLIDMFKWREVILVYERTNYMSDIIPSLLNSFQEKNVCIAYKSSISASSSDEQIMAELLKLMTLKTTVFVVHMSHLLMSRLFLKAKMLGMMNKGYAWVLTSTSMNLLHSMNSSVIESMQGVLGLKSYVPASISLHNLTSRLRRKFYIEELNLEVRELSANDIWAYDATWALAGAVERARTKSSTTRKPDIGLNLTNVNDIRSSKHGAGLLAEILQTRFKGLSGEIQYLNGRLISRGFEIVNVIGKGERRVGFWPCEEEKNIREPHHFKRRNLVFTKDLETIIWPGGSSTIPRGLKMQSTEVKLRIGVPVTRGFKELVHVDHDFQTNRTNVTGFCIDVFKAAISGLSYKVHYDFLPYPFEDIHGKLAGTYNDLVYQVHLQKFDAVVGDTTITSNRSLYVDFTIPYTDIGVGMLVPNEKESMWIFLKPLSADLWIASAGFFMLTGVVVWVIERPVNRAFQGSPSQQIGTIFCFLVFAHREKLLNNFAKFVMIIWVFVVLILTSSYTATLSSMMTVKQIQLNSRGTYIDDLSNFKGRKQYHSVEDYADALSRERKNGGVSAILDEIPYIKIFLANYPSGYSMIKPKLTTNGFGFAFRKGSKLVHDMSRQIEILREQGTLIEMEKAWFQSAVDTTSDPSLNPLNFNSFRGLFLVSGLSSAFALFLFFICSLKDNWHVVKQCILRYLIRGQLQRVRNFVCRKAFNRNEQINITQMVVLYV